MAGYRIKDLEQLSGIKAHTIRMWEKRYGILQPERTETQIRTYSDQELVLLLNVSLLNKGGIKISHIAAMNSAELAENVSQIKNDHHYDSSHEKLVLALVELDEHLFRDTLQELIEKYGLEETFVGHLIPFLEKIGVMWLVGSINPSQEHFMSNLIRQKIISEIDNLPIPDTSRQSIMLYLPEHEWHELSLLFYQFILRKAGKNTFYMGQSLPYDALIESIQKIKPLCLVTSWLTAVDLGFMKRYFQNLHKETNGIAVFAGGYQIKANENEISEWVTHIVNLDIIKNIVIKK